MSATSVSLLVDSELEEDCDFEELLGDWFICGRGVLNAPVEARCKRSNSSCSFGGRRGGEGPVAKAPLVGVELKKRREKR